MVSGAWGLNIRPGPRGPRRVAALKDAERLRGRVPRDPERKLLEPADALDKLLRAVRPIRDSERVKLDDAAGRALAEAVRAEHAVPDFTRSAMDGYAVRAADTRGAPVALALERTASHAGRAREDARVERGHCAYIATGAPLPAGADAVVPIESTEPGPDEGSVTIRSPVERGDSVRLRGHDVPRGSVVLRAGALLSPENLGLLAAVGRAEVEVWRCPHVTVASTGDELVAPGRDVGFGQIHDSNSYALAAALRAWGAVVDRRAPVKDSIAAVTRFIERADDADLVVLSGGSSVGERDLLVDAVREIGGRVLVHGIRLKPGKPLLVARLPEGRVLVGLPGNPTSALTVAHFFLAPVLRKMMGLPDVATHAVEAIISEDVEAPHDRMLVVPVRVEDGVAYPTFKDSGAITSIADSIGYVALAAGDVARAGDTVGVRSWW